MAVRVETRFVRETRVASGAFVNVYTSRVGAQFVSMITLALEPARDIYAHTVSTAVRFFRDFTFVDVRTNSEHSFEARFAVTIVTSERVDAVRVVLVTTDFRALVDVHTVS